MDILSYVLGKSSAGGGGGTGLVYETGEFVPTTDTSDATIYFEKEHTKSPFFVMLYDATDSHDGTSFTNYAFWFFDYHRFNEDGLYRSAQLIAYASVLQLYRFMNSSEIVSQSKYCSYSSDDEGASGEEYTKYWVDNTAFYPHPYSGCMYRANRTYKWIAVWN